MSPVKQTNHHPDQEDTSTLPDPMPPGVTLDARGLAQRMSGWQGLSSNPPPSASCQGHPPRQGLQAISLGAGRAGLGPRPHILAMWKLEGTLPSVSGQSGLGLVCLGPGAWWHCRPWPPPPWALGWDHVDRGGQSCGKGDGPPAGCAVVSPFHHRLQAGRSVIAQVSHGP